MDPGQPCFIIQVLSCTLKKLVYTILILCCALSNAFTQKISIGLGINYGGPLPTEAVDSASGKIIPGLTTGISFSIPFGKRFSFSPAFYYSYHGLEYSQSITQDTIITINIDNISGQVPSFYTAYVNGNMRIHYIDIPLLLTYRIKKFQFMIGPYFSVLIAGKDAGRVRVVIGKGGFFDDYIEDFDNFKAIRRLESGIVLGSNMPIYKKLSIEMKVSRSLFSFYRPGALPDRGQGGGKSYNTYVYMGLIYKIDFGKKSKQNSPS
jgi:hypothetical protein